MDRAFRGPRLWPAGRKGRWRTERSRGSPSGTSDSRTLCEVVEWGISRRSLPREATVTHLLNRTTGGLFLRSPILEMMSVPTWIQVVRRLTWDVEGCSGMG
jgi:hypothetical protein